LQPPSLPRIAGLIFFPFFLDASSTILPPHLNAPSPKINVSWDNASSLCSKRFSALFPHFASFFRNILSQVLRNLIFPTVFDPVPLSVTNPFPQCLAPVPFLFISLKSATVDFMQRGVLGQRFWLKKLFVPTPAFPRAHCVCTYLGKFLGFLFYLEEFGFLPPLPGW